MGSDLLRRVRKASRHIGTSTGSPIDCGGVAAGVATAPATNIPTRAAAAAKAAGAELGPTFHEEPIVAAGRVTADE
jgi:hypothetical protein